MWKQVRPGCGSVSNCETNVARDIRVLPADEKDMPVPAACSPLSGEAAPDFKLIDQRGREVTLRFASRESSSR